MKQSLRITLSFLTFILLALTAIAQPAKRQIKGRLADEGNKPVDYATVSVINAADSTLEKSTVSDKNGGFEINDLKNFND